MFTLSRLDTNLSLYLVADHNNTLPQLEERSFKEKLDLLLPTVERVYGADQRCMESWTSWLQAAQEFRVQRNALVHGRWGIDVRRQKVINVVGMPGSRQSETKYSLKQLEDAIENAERIAVEFNRLRTKWPM